MVIAKVKRETAILNYDLFSGVPHTLIDVEILQVLNDAGNQSLDQTITVALRNITVPFTEEFFNGADSIFLRFTKNKKISDQLSKVVTNDFSSNPIINNFLQGHSIISLDTLLYDYEQSLLKNDSRVYRSTININKQEKYVVGDTIKISVQQEYMETGYLRVYVNQPSRCCVPTKSFRIFNGTNEINLLVEEAGDYNFYVEANRTCGTTVDPNLRGSMRFHVPSSDTLLTPLINRITHENDHTFVYFSPGSELYTNFYYYSRAGFLRRVYYWEEELNNVLYYKFSLSEINIPLALFGVTNDGLISDTSPSHKRLIISTPQRRVEVPNVVTVSPYIGFETTDIMIYRMIDKVYPLIYEHVATLPNTGGTYEDWDRLPERSTFYYAETKKADDPSVVLKSPTIFSSALLPLNIGSSTNNISVYPNPTSNCLQINTNQSFTVRSQSGKKVMEGVVSNNSICLDNLPNGLYLLTVEHNNRYHTRKIIKKD